MALLTLLLNQPTLTTLQRVIDGKTVGITLDALQSEDISGDGEVTSHPIEDGADISDHVVIRPKKLSLKGFVTETPFTLAGRAQGAIASATGAIGQAIGGAVGGGAIGALGSRALQGQANKGLGGLLGLNTSANRQNLIYTELDNARKARLPVTVVTGLSRYENYLISNFTVSRASGDGKRVSVSVSLVELLRATSRTVKVPIPKVKSGVPKQSLGRQKADELTGEKGKSGSLAFQALKGLGIIKR